MPIHLKVETEVDGSSAQAAASKLQAHFQNAGRDSGVVFGKELSATMSAHLTSASVQRDLQNSLNTISKYGDATGKEFATNMASRMHIELTNAGQTHGTAYANAFNSALSGVANQFGISGSKAEAALGKVTSGAGVAALAVGGIGLAAIGVVGELYNLGSEWDSITDNVTFKTGLVGDRLDAVTESIKKVGVNSSASLGDIGDVAGSLVQSLHLTGKPLEDLTGQIAELDEKTGDKLNIRDLGKVFHGFNIDADNMGTTLNRLYDVSTNTGIPVSQLIETLKTVGPTAREISPDIGVAAGELATLEEAGINSEDAFKGLKIAMGNLSKDKAPGSLGDFLKDEQGKDLNTKIGDLITKIHETGDIDLAKSAFGKSWQPIFEVIRNGKLDVDTLNTSVANTGHTIEGSKQATDDWGEKLKELKNTLVVELEPAAKFVFGGISTMIQEDLIKPFQQLNNIVGGFINSFKSLTFPGVPGAPGVPGVTPGPGSGGGPALGPPSGGGSPGQNPLDIFAPTSGGHPGGPQLGTGGSGFGAAGLADNLPNPADIAAISKAQSLNGLPYTPGTLDCSGYISQIYSAMTGTPTHFTTTANFAALGFHPGFMPGALNIGVTPLPGNSGHMAGTLPNGVNVESGGSSGGVKYGSSTGAMSQQFQDHWYYLPGGTYDEGGILPPGTTVAQNNTGQPEAIINPAQTQMLQSFASGLQQGGGWGGLVGGFVNMGLNAQQQQQQSQSVQPGQQPSSRSPGGGDSSGGLIGSAAAMAANTIAPGSGALVQLATRAMKYVGQVASIGIMGGLETFLPGGTPLSDPSKSLIGRVASGIAGGQPASQNMAGAAKPPKPAPPLGSPASGAGLGPAPGPTNNGVHIDTMIVQNGDGEAAARDINRAYHGQAAGDNSR